MAHTVLMGQVERAAVATYQAALIVGAKPPSVDEARDRFDAHLVEEPAAVRPVDPAQIALRRALGVA